MPTALVRNGRVVTASESYDADLYVDGGKIALVGQGLSLPADTGDRRVGLPRPSRRDRRPHAPRHAGRGRLTSADDFETGTRAAAFGGTTTVIDFATPEPGQSLLAALDTWRRKAEGKAAVDYGFHMALRGVGDATLAEMARLTRDEGVTSFKLYLAYPGVLQVDDATFFRALLGARECGALPARPRRERRCHRRPGEAGPRAGETTPRHHALTRPAGDGGGGHRRAIALAEMAGAPLYVVHLTCATALAHVTAARDRGASRPRRDLPALPLPVDRDYDRPGSKGRST